MKLVCERKKDLNSSLSTLRSSLKKLKYYGSKDSWYCM